MAVTYQDAGPDVQEMLAELVDQYFDLLAVAEVTYRIQMAWGGLEHQGYPALGLIKVNSYKLRAQGLADVTIYLDADRWEGLGERRQRSVLHHELYHLELGKGWDAAERPKLRLRKHDHQLGIFAELIQIYGDDSVDRIVVEMMLDSLRQLGLPFGPDEPRSRKGKARDEAKAEKAETSGQVVKDTFQALLAVGNTEAQARASIDAALTKGFVFSSVPDMVDYIYRQSVKAVETATEEEPAVTLSINGRAVVSADSTAELTEKLTDAAGGIARKSLAASGLKSKAERQEAKRAGRKAVAHA